MTEENARTTANVLMAAAAVAAGIYVLRNPPLRRMVWRTATRLAVGPGFLWAVALVRESWEESSARRTA